jgi:L-aspartate oxidase
VAWAMAASAQFREESRGGHFRTDFPAPDDRRFRGHTLLEGGRSRLADVEMPLEVRVT